MNYWYTLTLNKNDNDYFIGAHTFKEAEQICNNMNHYFMTVVDLDTKKPTKFYYKKRPNDCWKKLIAR